ncbi:mannitol dehydrogenase family protein [Synoicihabitans lomoniglobus]|uniref:Mannitol dehydrogenase family protein n=1 Tax=Synoicihabitans lomoniglobus TaxID=2909285 RepID=A0AAE9ZVT9_9BACT|nr:mannitol dehydrogenase family protein [Opitutaceae bacterium LMO-M01]WED64089.1 mannitol dehydrogenase family protein [Opitutaceae bacterium LMO-M01]
MKESLRLNQQNLYRLPARVARPTYDRSRVKVGIVHIGVGGFHRSHQAFYTDELMETTGTTEWGICGVGLRDADRKIGDILKKQDHLYSLIVKHPGGQMETRVIGSLIDFMLSCDDPAAVIARMAHPETKIVSLTITEGGYNFSPATGEFDLKNPDVRHDLANPMLPRTIFGYLTASLQQCRSVGRPPFTVQSCDNIQHNGDMTRRMLLAFAAKQDPELARWIEREVCFPNAMVDRITPVTTPSDIEYLDTECGVKDEWPVTCEPFIQWVIEDHFCGARPAWETVGAQFVPDVTPYEKMKIRLLNAGHSVLGLLGSIHGHATIDGCMADPLFATYLRRFMDFEATPVLDAVEGIDLDDYKDCLIERFGNPNIKDNLARICLESSSKLPKFLIPTITENLTRGGSIEYATLVIAAWCFYSDKGTSRHGAPLDIVDDLKAELNKAAADTPRDPLSFLKLKPVFGDLVRHQTFTTTYTRMVNALYENPDIARQMQTILFGQE